MKSMTIPIPSRSGTTPDATTRIRSRRVSNARSKITQLARKCVTGLMQSPAYTKTIRGIGKHMCRIEHRAIHAASVEHFDPIGSDNQDPAIGRTKGMHPTQNTPSERCQSPGFPTKKHANPSPWPVEFSTADRHKNWPKTSQNGGLGEGKSIQPDRCQGYNLPRNPRQSGGRFYKNT